MDKIRKITGVMLAFAMVLALLPVSVHAAVYANEEKAQNLYDMGLYSGTSSTDFVPDLGSTLTREQGVVLLLKVFMQLDTADAMTLKDAETMLTSRFSDAAKISSWAKKRVAYAVKNNIISGRPSGVFDPTGMLKGKDYATMILKQLGKQPNWQTAVQDLAKICSLSPGDAEKFNDKYIIRDDAVGITYGALTAGYEDGSGTVIQKLAAKDDFIKALAIEEGLLKETVEVKIVSIAAIPDITVSTGEKPLLPVKVAVTYSNKTTAEAAVTWGAVDTSAAGVKTVDGTVQGTELKARVNIIVRSQPLAVVSVNAVNSTRIEAVLSRTKEAADSIAFEVKQDTTVYAVDTVSFSADGRTAVINLKTPLNEAVFTVNGVSSTYVRVPPKVIGIAAINATQIRVTFDRELDGTGAETAGNYSYVNKMVIQSPIQLVSSMVKLSADKKSVLITLMGSDLAAKSPPLKDALIPNIGMTNDEYIIYISNGTATKVMSLDGVPVRTNDNATFKGTSGVDSTPPSLVKAYYSSTARKLNLEFDEPVYTNAANFKVTSVSVGSGTSVCSLTALDTVYISDNTVSITLNNDSAARMLAAVSTPGASVTLAAGAVMDTAQNRAGALTVPVSISQTPQVMAARYDESTQVLELTFDSAIDVSRINSLSAIQLLGGYRSPVVLNMAYDRILTTANGTSLMIKLSRANAADFEGPAMGAPALPRVTALQGAFKSVEGVDSILSVNIPITYINDNAKPTVVSAMLDLDRSELTVRYSEPVGTYGDTSVSVVDTSTGTSITSAAVIPSPIQKEQDTNEPTVVYRMSALPSGAAAWNINTTLRLAIGPDRVKDVAGNSLDQLTAGSNCFVTPTGSQQPKVLSAASIHNRMVAVVFTQAMDQSSLENANNYSITVTGNVNRKLTISKADMSSDRLTVFLTTDAQETVNYQITVTGVKSAQFKDIDPGFNLANFSGSGSSVAGSPVIIPQTIYLNDNDNSTYVSAGDTFTVRFNQPVVIADYTKVFNQVPAGMFGVNYTITKGSFVNDVVVTLGAGATRDVLATNGISTAAGITTGIVSALNGQVAAASAATVLPPKNRIAAPRLLSALLTDVNNNGRVDENDTLTLTFDQELYLAANSYVDTATLNAMTDDLKLAKSDGTLTNPPVDFALALKRATWDPTTPESRKNLVLTLNSGPGIALDFDQYATVPAGSTGPLRDVFINTVPTADKILNEWNIPAEPAPAFVRITSATSYAVNIPRVVSAVYYDNGAPGTSPEDYIKVRFSATVSGGSVSDFSFTDTYGTAKSAGTSPVLVQTAPDEYAVCPGGAGINIIPGHKVDVVFGTNTIVDISGTRAAPVGGVTITAASTVADATRPGISTAALYSAYATSQAAYNGGFTNNGTLTVAGRVNGAERYGTRSIQGALTALALKSAIQEILGLPVGTVAVSDGARIQIQAAGYIVKNVALMSSTSGDAFNTAFSSTSGWIPSYMVRVTMNETIQAIHPMADVSFVLLGSTFANNILTPAPQSYGTQFDVLLNTLPAVSNVATAAIGVRGIGTTVDLADNGDLPQNASTSPAWIALPAAP